MARPSLSDSLMASLSKGVHVETAEKIARGLPPIPEETPPSPPLAVTIKPVTIADPVVAPVKAEITDVIVNPVTVSTKPVVVKAPIVDPVTISSPPEMVYYGDRAIEQTIEQINNQTIKQTAKKTNNEASTIANKQAINEAVRQSNEQTIQHFSDQSGSQTTEQAIKQTSEQSHQQTIGQTFKQSDEQTIKHSPKHLWLPLNENQGKILLFLYERGQGLTNMDIICMHTGVAYGTARTSIDVLMREGYVTGKTRHNGHAFRGFDYTLNNHLCSLYVSRIRGEQSSEQSLQQLIKQSGNQSNKQTIGQTINQTVAPFSSKVLEDFENLTTTKTGLLEEPELRFWAGEGVTEKQVQNWMAEFQLTIEEIQMSLRYARFDILERGDVQNAANWFYKILTRNGFYPRPANYRSLIEIKAEALKQQQERDREARAILEDSDLETKFQAFLSDPEAPIFKQLFDQVNSFAKEQFKEGQKMAAEIELRELFKKAR